MLCGRLLRLKHSFDLILNLVNDLLINYNPAQCPTCLKASIYVKRIGGSREKVENPRKYVFVCQKIFCYVRDKSPGSTYMPTHTPVAVGPH